MQTFLWFTALSYCSRYVPTAANEPKVSHIHRKRLTSALKNKVDSLWYKNTIRNSESASPKFKVRNCYSIESNIISILKDIHPCCLLKTSKCKSAFTNELFQTAFTSFQKLWNFFICWVVKLLHEDHVTRFTLILLIVATVQWQYTLFMQCLPILNLSQGCWKYNWLSHIK